MLKMFFEKKSPSEKAKDQTVETVIGAADSNGGFGVFDRRLSQNKSSQKVSAEKEKVIQELSERACNQFS